MENTEELPPKMLTFSAFLTAPERRDDRTFIFIWIPLVFYGYLCNFLLVFIILRTPTIRSQTWYWFVLCICACDTMQLLLTFGMMFPAVIWRERFMQIQSFRNAAGMFGMQVFWYSFQLGLVTMSINRVVSVVFPTRLKRIFTRRTCAILIAAIFIGGTSFAAPNLNSCCYVLLIPSDYVAMIYPPDSWFVHFDLSVSISSTVLILACYAVIIFKLHNMGRRRREQKDAHVREMRLCVQFGIVVIIFVIASSNFVWVPYLHDFTKWHGAYVCYSNTLQSSVQPSVSLFFNSQVKQRFREIFWRRKKSSIHPSSLNASS